MPLITYLNNGNLDIDTPTKNPNDKRNKGLKNRLMLGCTNHWVSGNRSILPQ